MLHYLFKRLLGFVPTIILLMVFSFWLAKEAPGDPFQISSFQNERHGFQQFEKVPENIKPLFFFSISPLDKQSNKLKWIPWVEWHGSNNQFYKWSKALLTGGFGKSTRYKVDVWKIILKPFLVSIFLGTTSTILLILISIWLAKLLSLWTNQTRKNFVWTVLDLIYAIPSYWLAVLLLTFFASASFFKVFPSGGLLSPQNENPLLFIPDLLYHLALPIICLSIPPIAYYTKIIFQNINQESQKIYALSAAARGFSPKWILNKELLRNSLIPLTTHLPLFLSSILGGALIIEKIFNLPGMGKLMIEAFSFRDYPIIFSVAFITGIVTMVGFLLTDILLQRLSPEIKSSMEKPI